MTSLRRRGATALGVLVAMGGVLTPVSASPPHADGRVEIRVLSNRADLLSGADALVEVVVPRGADASRLRVSLGGRDVTRQLRPLAASRLLDGVPVPDALGVDARPNALVGLVTGLRTGPNVLRAQLSGASGAAGATLTLVNHPSSGPVFAGPQVQPWTCNDGATSRGCDRAATYTWFYVPRGVSPSAVPPAAGAPGAADPYFLPYDPAAPPAEGSVATTTTDAGRVVPFVVRVETGSVDRGQYRIAVLADPARGWTATTPQRAWNHKLFFVGGPGCGISYAEGAAPDVLFGRQLARGMAVLSTSLGVTGSDCNPVRQAESLLMAKEHLIERYGLVRWTTSIGGSGASLVQQWIANAYPGIFDGLVVEASFPDAGTPLYKVEDCLLLLDYWTHPERWAPGVTWTPAQQSLVLGGNAPSSCAVWKAAFESILTPGDETGQVPADQVYDPATNPRGVRGTLWDYSVAQLGRRASPSWTSMEKRVRQGFANNPLDTEGIQYGLTALEAGLLTPAQFVDLNAKVGGHDVDHRATATRTRGDPAGVVAMYRSGFLNETDHLDVPIIDVRSSGSNAEIHDTYFSWSTRARLDRARGNHDNQVIWQSPTGSGFAIDQRLEFEAFDLMDEWLTRIEARPGGSRAARVRAAKPAAAHDRCAVTGTGAPGPCVPDLSGGPRSGAGGPLAEDVAQCTRRSPERTDYPVTFSDAQWTALVATFPTGVCDYSRPGVGQQATVPWLTYAAGPGGRPLGPAPRSSPA